MKIKIKVIIAMAFAAIMLAAGMMNAQESKSLKKRVKEIKGDVQKITITVDGKDVIFEGKEAAKLFRKMKKGMTRPKMMAFMPDIDDEDLDISKNIRVEVLGGDDDEGEFLVKVGEEDKFKFNEKDTEEGQKMINVEKNDDGLIVTGKTNENGEIKTEKYEGEETEKFLEEMKDEDDLQMEIEDEDGDNNFIWMGKGGKYSGHGKHVFLKKIDEGDGDEDVREIIIKKVKKDKEEEK